MEKCETSYAITDSSKLVDLVDSIAEKGWIGIDFKYDNIGKTTSGDKLLLIDADQSLHIPIIKEQIPIAKQYMILLFIVQLYEFSLLLKISNVNLYNHGFYNKHFI